MNYLPSDEHDPLFNQPIILTDSVENEPQVVDLSPPGPKSYAEAFAESEKKTVLQTTELYSQIRINSNFPEPTPHKDMDLYLSRICWMNNTFQLENNALPTNLGVVRLLKFYKTLIDEVAELVECINDKKFVEHILANDPFLTESDDPEYIDNLVRDYQDNNLIILSVNMVALADTLVDINVYDTSEFMRWGIPIEECLHAVMESQVTKLDTNGLPIKSPDNAKFIKGPYYQPPEPEIQEILDVLTYE